LEEIPPLDAMASRSKETLMHKKKFAAIALSSAVAATVAAPLLVEAQSLKPKSATPLKSGINRAAIDSFGGEQFWCFTAEPGHFHIVFERSGSQEGFSVGNKAGMAAAFAPKTAGSTIKDNATGTVFDGSVAHPTRCRHDRAAEESARSANGGIHDQPIGCGGRELHNSI
jgi:hypothetical protein